MTSEPWIAHSIKRESSFQDYAHKLLSLSPDQLASLSELTHDEHGFDSTPERVEMVSHALGLSQTETSLLLDICAYLYGPTARGRDPSQLLEELESLASELGWELDLETKRGSLRQLFSIDHPFALYLHRERAIRGAMPVLQRVLMECDMRVVSDSDDHVLGYVPVIIARLEFDEELAGQPSISFQVTEAGLDDLESLARALRDQVAQARLDFEEKLF